MNALRVMAAVVSCVSTTRSCITACAGLDIGWLRIIALALTLMSAASTCPALSVVSTCLAGITAPARPATNSRPTKRPANQLEVNLPPSLSTPTISLHSRHLSPLSPSFSTPTISLHSRHLSPLPLLLLLASTSPLYLHAVTPPLPLPYTSILTLYPSLSLLDFCKFGLLQVTPLTSSWLIATTYVTYHSTSTPLRPARILNLSSQRTSPMLSVWTTTGASRRYTGVMSPTRSTRYLAWTSTAPPSRSQHHLHLTISPYSHAIAYPYCLSPIAL